MRRQSGTSSLRALLYMDEIFGYFPPSAMPPSKQPLLTLMKQARAFGLGVVLATQNPVDLDYKGLSNAGTWLIGRLQTERDKARVIEGLLSTDGGMDKGDLQRLLASLSARVFLMRNAQDDAPVLFRTRWALSYLRGPLTLAEIGRLQKRGGAEAAPSGASPVASSAPGSATSSTASPKPLVPADIAEYYARTGAADGELLLPRVLGKVRLHFIDKSCGVDVWETRSYLAPLDDEGDADWLNADVASDLGASLVKTPPSNARYAEAPASVSRAQSYAAWKKRLAAHAQEQDVLNVLRCALVGAVSKPGATEGELRAQIALALREKRDAAVDALRKKYAPRLATLADQMRRAQDRIERERSQLSEQKLQTAFSVGSSILGALLGRKKMSVTNVGRIGTAARSAGRIGRESGDVNRAEESLEVVRQRHAELESELNAETEKLKAELDPAAVAIEQVALKPRKSDIDVQEVALVWSLG
jgi:hypothetical protein